LITKLLDVREAAELLGISPRTLDGYRSKGVGPNYFRDRKKIKYRLQDIEAYIAENIHVPSAQSTKVAEKQANYKKNENDDVEDSKQ